MDQFHSFTVICSRGFSWKQISFGSGNGLLSNIWQAIIWTNNCLVYRRLYASLGLNALKNYFSVVGSNGVLVIKRLKMDE